MDDLACSSSPASCRCSWPLALDAPIAAAATTGATARQKFISSRQKRCQIRGRVLEWLAARSTSSRSWVCSGMRLLWSCCCCLPPPPKLLPVSVYPNNAHCQFPPRARARSTSLASASSSRPTTSPMAMHRRSPLPQPLARMSPAHYHSVEA